MNTDKVFIAYTKYGKELFLYKKDKDVFIDLLSDDTVVFPIDEIDLSSLIKADKLLDLDKYMFKYLIKRKYIKDRERELNTKEYLIGLKVMVNNYKTWYEGTNMYNLVKYHKWVTNTINYDLYSLIDREKVSFDTIVDIYKNFSNDIFYGYKINNEPERFYHIPNFENGKEYVVITDSLFNLIDVSYIDKKRASEIAYKLRKNLFDK